MKNNNLRIFLTVLIFLLNGTVYGQSYVYGIKSTSPSDVIINTNNYTLSSSISGYGIYASGSNPTISNFGDLNVTSAISIGIYTPSTTGSFTNINNTGNFNISGTTSSAGIYTLGDNSTVTNKATINSYATGVGLNPTLSFGIDPEDASNVVINNSGNLNVFGNAAVTNSTPIGIFSSGNNINIINTGSINLSAATGQYLVDDGLISPGGIVCFGCSGTITNKGTITASGMGIAAYGISNTGTISNARTITTLNNSQGAGNAAGALTLTGTLPLNYNVMINSTTVYGQLNVSNFNGHMNFGISDTSSILSSTTYVDVLQGFSTLTGVNYSGSFKGYTYSFVADTNNDGYWNLVIGSGGAAPEMNASLIPQVGLLLGCLFFMYGRKREDAS